MNRPALSPEIIKFPFKQLNPAIVNSKSRKFSDEPRTQIQYNNQSLNQLQSQNNNKYNYDMN